jgi:hypothetical protein
LYETQQVPSPGRPPAAPYEAAVKGCLLARASMVRRRTPHRKNKPQGTLIRERIEQWPSRRTSIR